MDNVNSPLNTFTSDMEVDIDEADARSSGFDHRNPIVIDSGDDDGDESDTTLLGDDFEQRLVTPNSEPQENGGQARAQDVNFRELQSYTRDGHTIRIGRLSRDREGNFLRVISIKQHRSSGNVTIEGLRDDHRMLQTHSYSGRTLRPGKTVELTDGTFVRIVSILEDRRTSEISLKGFQFQRAVKLAGMLPLKPNEVAMVIKIDDDDPRGNLEQSTELYPLSAVVKIRELVKTNQPFPALNFREIDPDSIGLGKDYMNDHCRLVCRWNYVKVNENEGFLRRVSDVESDEGCCVSQDQLRDAYRGPTNKGEYTFSDGFSGAGGASRGSQAAGFWIVRAFDHDPDSVATYRLNFPLTNCECISAHDFAMSNSGAYKTAVLHLSPPCPPFPPLHNRPFPNDEQNQAAFLATEELIKKTKPRIVTLEQTFGLTRTRENRRWFRDMIQTFAKLGFSVRWRVFNLQDFGLPQPRKRLLLFASW